MNNPGILGAFVIVSFGMAIPFLCLLLGWLTPSKQEGPHSLRASLLRLALWLASLSLVSVSVSLMRVQMLAPRLPSIPWITVNWISGACWLLVLLLTLFGKGKPRIALLGWAIAFPIFSALLFITAYTY